MTLSDLQFRYLRNSRMEDRPGEVIFLNKYAEGPRRKSHFPHMGSLCTLQEDIEGDTERLHGPQTADWRAVQSVRFC